ncbi:MAG: 7TM diverse intracellular signaling domain-containing protein [Sulfurovum sp.]
MKIFTILLLIILSSNLYANYSSLLESSEIYIDKSNNLHIKDVIKQNLLKPYNKEAINIGMMNKTIFIKLQVTNHSDKIIKRVLVLTSPLLEHIALFTSSLDSYKLKGVLYLTPKHSTLFPFYDITIEANSSDYYYLEIRSAVTPIDFRVLIQDKEGYLLDDRDQQFIDIAMLGFVFALMLYSLLLFFYIGDKSYLYYSIYLFMIISQQITYIGLTQIYLPIWFIKLDMWIPVQKIDILIIFSALFAIHFLKIEKGTTLYRIYRWFILISILEIIFLHQEYYDLYVVIFIGFLFIIFNLSAGIIRYKRGHTQARLFILGFSIVFISYMLMILNALALTSIIQDYQNILMLGTAFEALILSLAFADRYAILEKSKAKVDEYILKESKNRANIIQKEVIHKTKELNEALDIKELLLKEVHHRVKNNLQIILSIIRLEKDNIENKYLSSTFTNLENRINAISKTYNMLLLKDNIEEIDMREYIEGLVLDIKESLHQKDSFIDIKTDIDATIPLRESVYIGLIINELVTNSYKYAFEYNRGTITITLYKELDIYILIIRDDGRGFYKDKKSNSLGIKLIKTLVYGQLDGEMEVSTKDETKYIIRFKI